MLIQIDSAQYINSGKHQKHLNTMRAYFRKKHDKIIKYLKNDFPNEIRLYGMGGMMYFVMEIKTKLTQKEIIKIFKKHDVGVSNKSILEKFYTMSGKSRHHWIWRDSLERVR